MTSNNSKKYNIEYLDTLNQRTRFYVDRLWKIPLAFLAICIVAVTGTADHALEHLSEVTLLLIIASFFVLLHILGLIRGTKRAVNTLSDGERDTGVVPKDRVVNYNLGLDDLPLVALHVLVMIALFILLFNIDKQN